MKEIKVAKLDKEDSRVFREVTAQRTQMEHSAGVYLSMHKAFWNDLRAKHNLTLESGYYILHGIIYKQSV